LSVDASFDAPHLEAWALLFPPEFAVTGNAKGELQLSGTWESPTGGLRLKASELDIQGGTALYPPGPFQLDCELAIKDRRVIFNNFLIESANLFFSASGYWAVDLAHEKISVEENFWQRGDVEFNGKLRIPDISWAANRWQDLREVAGELDADISIKGSVQKPTMNATLNLQNGKIQAVKELTPIRALSVHAKADTEKIQIETMTGELGSAPFQVSGALFFDPKVEPRLDFHLKGENLLLFRDDGVKLRADADIGLKGQFHAMELAGDIHITEGRFTKDFDFLDLLRQSKRPKDKPGSNLFSLRDPPFKGMVFNVRVSSRNPFILKNNLTNASLRPELFLKGTGEVPVLVGEVYVDPSYIKLPSGRLAVESGVIRFMEAAPGMPRINLPAQTYISGYDISMLMEGLWNEPHVTLSSIPILPAEDLLLMVLTGKPPKGNTGSGRFSGAELNIAVYFGKGLLSQLFGAKLTESAESTIDRFELDIGRGATQGGQETLEAQYRLAEGVIFEGDTLYIAGERDAYDDFNAGLKIIFRFR
jgi:translocation and assembly module TamB